MSIPSDVRDWLAFGERGISSNTIVQHLTGADALRGSYGSYPRDPDDLTRCVRLLESCPSLVPEFHRMREVSPVWAGLVDVWDELVATMNAEAPNWRNHRGSAPRTYTRMQRIIAAGEAKREGVVSP